MMVKTRTNVYDFNFHLVWVTKYRKETFTTIEKQNAMQDMLTHICDEHDNVMAAGSYLWRFLFTKSASQ